MNRAYCEFEFDLPGALLVRLVEVLDGLDRAPLTQMGLEGVPDAQGVYQLFLDGKLVYIGKTDAEAGLRKRLERHTRKILHRINLSPERVEYKAVRIYVFTAIDLETQLIKHYAGEGGTAWNNSGFGANDPGRRRDRTRIKDSNFDAQFPIDLDRALDISFADCETAAQALLRLKLAVPYTVRFENSGRSRQPHSDFVSSRVSLASIRPTAREVLTSVVSSLPAGWQVTALRSHIVLYRERDDSYPDAMVLGRS